MSTTSSSPGKRLYDGSSQPASPSTPLRELLAGLEERDGTQPNNRKKAHVISEQKRREGINRGFEELRNLVPHARANDSKAAILCKAGIYIQQLGGEVNKLRQAVMAMNGGSPHTQPAQTLPPISRDKQDVQQGPIPSSFALLAMTADICAKKQSPPLGSLLESPQVQGPNHNPGAGMTDEDVQSARSLSMLRLDASELTQ